MTECMICIESFNKSTRKPATCPYCSTTACRICIQTCILQDNIPHCQNPDCRKDWSDEFLSSILTKVWLDSAYKTHRQKILLDQEKARLPETQEQAAIYINAKVIVNDIQPRISALQEQIRSMPIAQERVRLLREYQNATNATDREQRNAAWIKYRELIPAERKEARPFKRQIKVLRSEAFRVALHHTERYGENLGTPQTTQTVKKTWTFVGKCPKTECQGFVGLEYACGLCKVVVCKECMEPQEEGHACNTDNVLNVCALRKEAKPCPKCASMISKIDGCDQMWCTQCHTAFSWRTGAEEKSIHNPHFYEWMRRSGRAMAPGPVNVGNAPNQAPCGFDEIRRDFITRVHPENRHGLNWVRTAVGWGLPQTLPAQTIRFSDNQKEKLFQIVQSVAHVQWTQLAYRTNQIRNEDRINEEAKRVLRVRRLANEITDDEWKVPLQQMERASKISHTMRDIYDMYTQASMGLMTEFNEAHGRGETADVLSETICNAYKELVEYTNVELRKAANRFSTSVSPIRSIV